MIRSLYINLYDKIEVDAQNMPYDMQHEGEKEVVRRWPLHITFLADYQQGITDHLQLQ